jgi:putative nucleotidyltransferase with HDIG domain
MMKNYQDALTLLHEYVKSESLLKHMYSVEAAMRAYAKKYGEDEELWGIAGLLHDFDYELYPTKPEHAVKGADILREKGWDESIIQAILGHANYSGVPRTTVMAKALYACDELCGLITAVALLRPNKIMDLGLSSVKKRFKTKSFAAGVNRDEIEEGAQELGIPLDEHITFVIAAMKTDAERLGLKP